MVFWVIVGFDQQKCDKEPVEEFIGLTTQNKDPEVNWIGKNFLSFVH